MYKSLVITVVMWIVAAINPAFGQTPLSDQNGTMRGIGAPVSTLCYPQTVGQLYIDKSTGNTYACTQATPNATPAWALSVGGNGSNGLMSFSTGNLSPLFSASLGANPTTAPALAFTPSTAAQNAFLAGPASGGPGAYSFRSLVAADIAAAGTLTNNIGGNAATASNVPASGITGSPITGSGTNIPTGPGTTVQGDLITYANTAGGQQDSGIAPSSLATASALATETSNRTSGDSANATAISTETTRAQGAESANATAIAAETTNRVAAINALQTSLPYTPLARYRMNQTSGPPTDSSGNGYNCTSTGGTVTWAANGTRVYGNGYDNCPSAAVSGAKTVSVTYAPNWNLMHASTTPDASYAAVWGVDSNYNLNLPMWMSNGGVTFNSISTIETGTADKYQGYVTVTVVLGAGANACSMYINGQPIKSLAYQAGCPTSLSSSSELYLGTVGGIPNGAYINMAQFTSYTQALTPAQVLQDYQANVQSIYTPQGLQVGFDPTDYSKPCVIYIGDSKWSNTLNNYNYATAEPSYVDALLGPSYNTWNIAINGELLSAMYTNYALTVQPILNQCTSKTNVVAVEGGVNDIHGGTSAAALYTIAQNFTTAIHGSGAYAVFQTLTPSGWLTSGNGLLAVETAYNADLVGYASLDALDRADLNPIMGSQAAIASSTYYNNSDGSQTHWSPLGAQILSYGTAEAIASVLNGGQSVRTVKVPVTYLTTNAAATTMTIPLMQLGPRQQIIGGAVRVGSYSTGAGGSATFTGTGITGLTCTLGDSSGSATSYISTSMNLMANSRYLFGNTSFFSLSGQPELVCTATGGNFSALTGGYLDVSLTVVTQ